MIALLEYLLGWGLWALLAVWHFLVRFVRQRPVEAGVVLLAIVRSFGTTVQTGTAGVLFTCGRARKVLEPGFQPLIPIFQRVRVTPIRSVTLDLPKQRVATGDGLVYEVDTTIVYRVEDPILALTGIDDVNKGVQTLLPLLVHDILRKKTQQTLVARQALDEELTEKARVALARWGLVVEQAGLTTLAPSRHTTRLSQQAARVRERAKLLAEMVDEVDDEAAVALVSGTACPTSRAQASRARRARDRRLLAARKRKEHRKVEPVTVEVLGMTVEVAPPQQHGAPDQANHPAGKGS
jgi:regulator of protease activity HflC (stomatin/prohibitin superfamily)